MAGLVPAGDLEMFGVDGVAWRFCPGVLPGGLWSSWGDAPSPFFLELGEG